jgi:hypothetical protein
MQQDQNDKQVFDSATRLLAAETKVTTEDIAADTGLEVSAVARALEALSVDHLHVEHDPDWEHARVQSVEGEFGGWL